MQSIATRLLSVEQFAEACGISRSAVFLYLGAGQISSVKLGRKRRIPSSELARVEQEGLPLLDRKRP